MGKLIGVFAAEVSSRVQANLYRQLHSKAITEGYNLVFFSATYERFSSNIVEEDVTQLFDFAEQMEFSAFLVYSQSLSNCKVTEHIIDMGKKKDIPVFLYDCDNEGYSKEDGVITINLDYKQGFADSVRHLIEHHGCKNIFMLAGMRDNVYSDDRIAMYKQELLAHGQTFDEKHVFYGDFWEIPAAEAVRSMFADKSDLPDAICCANDSMAIAAAKTIIQLGYRVPEDVLITGFDGIEDGKYNFPVIATCEPMVETVPDFFFDAIRQDMRSGEFLVPLQFFPKESCGCSSAYVKNDKIEIARLMEIARQNSWQHSMLSNMQLELMDCCNIDEVVDYMKGTIGMFRGFSHLYCIREDVEYQTDFSSSIERVQPRLNLNFLPEGKYEAFPMQSVIPFFDQIFYQAKADEIFIFQLLKSVHKNYGYSITKATRFPSNELKIFAQFAESFTNMMENTLRNIRLDQANRKLSEMYERMSEISIRDMLTGLYNRHGFYRDLEVYRGRADLQDSYLHIISVDMDGMKFINDNFGHQEGDVAIKAVAMAIHDCFAQPCISARFGGDEFVVALFTEMEDKPTQDKLSIRLNGYLETLPILQDKKYSVAVSVGHAVRKMSELTELKELEKMADDSMYKDKRKRKGNDVR